MSARAIWKARLRVGKESLGVKLYAAVRDRGIHFRLLHAKDGVPVRQRMVHPGNGDVVEHADMVRGVEFEPGRFVRIDAEDLARIDPEPSRDLVVLRTVPLCHVGGVWFDRPYWLGPDDGADEPYEALAQALAAEQLAGVARWTLRKRDSVGALLAERGRLALVTLRHANEVLALSGLEAPPGPEIRTEERELATRLVDALSGPFEPDQYHEEYRGRVLALLEAKRHGRTVKLERYRPKRTTDAALVKTLERSLRRAG